MPDPVIITVKCKVCSRLEPREARVDEETITLLCVCGYSNRYWRYNPKKGDRPLD